MRAPLALAQWHERWLVLPSWRVLHRIAEIEWKGGERIWGDGIAVCGARGRFAMPGVLSRMGRPRCVRCCGALRLPRGYGAPYNDRGELSAAEREL